MTGSFVLAQAQSIEPPDIAWSAISPELLLFGFGLVALLIDTAGAKRLQVSLGTAAVVLAGAVLLYTRTDEFLLPGLLALGAVTQLALSWIWRDRPRMLGAILAAIGFAAALGATIWLWLMHAGELVTTTDPPQELVGTSTALANMVAVDGLALFTKVTVCLAGLLVIPLGFSYAEARRMHRGEYYPLLLFSATGMTLLASSADLIMVFISYEILSLALYVLCAFARRDLVSQESALKYFLLGAFSSALLLYGIAVTYGVAGSTNIAAAGAAFSLLDAPTEMTLAAMALLFVGFAFKTSLVPFHMWTPDVYQGAPTPVTAFMSAATKAAAFAAFLRLFLGGFAPLQWSWQRAFWIVAIVTMVAGSIWTLVQRDLKRMLAYSTVTHAGYVLIGMIAVTREGLSSVLLYLFIYMFMTLGAFGVLTVFERRQRKALSLEDVRGLGRLYPVPAGMLGLFLLSLAGIPGTAGFIAKLGVFRVGIDAGHWVLVGVAILSSLVAAFPYIRVIVAMFMEPAPDEAPETAEPIPGAGVVEAVDHAVGEPAEVPAQVPVDVPGEVPEPLLRPSLGMSTALIVTSVAVVVLGILPVLLIEFANRSASIAG